MDNKKTIPWPFILEKDAIILSKNSYSWFYQQRKIGKLNPIVHGRKNFYLTSEIEQFTPVKSVIISYPTVEEIELIQLTQLSSSWFYLQRKNGTIKRFGEHKKIYYKTTEIIDFWAESEMEVNHA